MDDIGSDIFSLHPQSNAIGMPVGEPTKNFYLIEK